MFHIPIPKPSSYYNRFGDAHNNIFHYPQTKPSHLTSAPETISQLIVRFSHCHHSKDEFSQKPNVSSRHKRRFHLLIIPQVTGLQYHHITFAFPLPTDKVKLLHILSFHQEWI